MAAFGRRRAAGWNRLHPQQFPMDGLTVVGDQKFSAEDDLLGEILELQVALAPDRMEVAVGAGGCRRQLQVAMEIAEGLQVTDLVEELREQHSLVDACADLDELILRGIPHRGLEAFVDQVVTATPINQSTDAPGLGHVLDDATEQALRCTLELDEELCVAARLVLPAIALVGEQCQPYANEHADNAGERLDQEFDDGLDHRLASAPAGFSVGCSASRNRIDHAFDR